MDLDGLLKFPWPWNMYLYSSGLKKHGMIAPWDAPGLERQGRTILAYCLLSQLVVDSKFFTTRERSRERGLYSSNLILAWIDTRVGYNDWLQTMKHALRSIAWYLPGLGLRVNLATCDVETINILTDFWHFTRFPAVSSFVTVFIHDLNEADSETSHCQDVTPKTEEDSSEFRRVLRYSHGGSFVKLGPQHAHHHWCGQCDSSELKASYRQQYATARMRKIYSLVLKVFFMVFPEDSKILKKFLGIELVTWYHLILIVT